MAAGAAALPPARPACSRAPCQLEGLARAARPRAPCASRALTTA